MGLNKRIPALALALLLLGGTAQATINYPSVLDDNATLFNVATGDVYIAQYHNNPKDAILALEAKVGVDNSAVSTSLDYLMKSALSVNPGHTHTSTALSFVDGSVGAPSIRFGTPVTDTGTGFYHPGSASIALTASGVEIVRSYTTGLGFFVTDPYFPIDVLGTIRLRSGSTLCFGGTGASDNDTCLSRSAAHVATLAGSLIATDQAVGDTSLTLNGIAAKTGNFLSVKLLAADANPAVAIDKDGKLQFGAGGGSAPDANLYRTLADQLKTDDSLVVDGIQFRFNNDGALATQFQFGTINGVKLGTNTSNKISFYGVSPSVIQPTASTALITALQNLGLIATGTYSGDITTTGNVTIGTSGAAITRTLTGSAALDFAAPGVVPGCSADLTITVTNSALGDPVVLGVPNGSVADVTQNFSAWVSVAGTVTVRSCQLANAAANPASGTFKVRVIQ